MFKLLFLNFLPKNATTPSTLTEILFPELNTAPPSLTAPSLFEPSHQTGDTQQTIPSVTEPILRMLYGSHLVLLLSNKDISTSDVIRM
jgi:hypothetical protein